MMTRTTYLIIRTPFTNDPLIRLRHPLSSIPSPTFLKSPRLRIKRLNPFLRQRTLPSPPYPSSIPSLEPRSPPLSPLHHLRIHPTLPQSSTLHFRRPGLHDPEPVSWRHDQAARLYLECLRTVAVYALTAYGTGEGGADGARWKGWKAAEEENGAGSREWRCWCVMGGFGGDISYLAVLHLVENSRPE